MKISPFILLLGLIVLPETIITVPIFPFGRADAATIVLHDTVNDTVNDTVTTTTAGSLECDACLYLANGVNQTVLHNPKVIAFVTSDIEKVCSVLPESVQAMCNDAAQSVAPLLLNHLGDFIVTEGCQDLGVCH
jgi:hypothetical protein